MRRVISFGSYTFPDTVPERGELLRATFADTVPRVTRLPGMDGGFDEYGDDPAARDAATIRARFVLIADTPEDMADAHDAVMAMARYGRDVLTVETSGGDERWTYARVIDIAMPTGHDSVSDKLTEVTVDFQVALPFWYATSEDSPQTEACSGTSTTFIVTNAGNATAIPVITVDPATNLASGVTVQRIVSSVVVDEIDYDAALLSSDVLVIDCRSLTVRKNGSDAYGTAFTADHPAWMRLLPGSNSLKVILGGGESASVTVAWDDTWV